MTLKIERSFQKGKAYLRLSGRIGFDNLEELKAQLEGQAASTLDMEQVTLVDLDAIRLLVALEAEGTQVVHCSAYIREWMARERKS